MEDRLCPNIDIDLLDSGLSYYCVGTNYRSADPVRLKVL